MVAVGGDGAGIGFRVVLEEEVEAEVCFWVDVCPSVMQNIYSKMKPDISNPH